MNEDATPLLLSANVACQPCGVVRDVVDMNALPGEFEGAISWGPNSISGFVNDSMIDGYRVYIVDQHGRILPVSGSAPDYVFTPSRHLTQPECCDVHSYSVTWRVSLPEGYDSFMVVAWSELFGTTPAGAFVKIVDATDWSTAGPTYVTSLAAMRFAGFSPVRAVSGAAMAALAFSTPVCGQYTGRDLDDPACHIAQGPALLLPQYRMAPRCGENSTTSSTTTTVTNTTTTTTASVTTSIFYHPCTCPSPSYDTLYGPISEGFNDDSVCCGVESGSKCSVYHQSQSPGSNPCIADGHIEFRCPCENLANNTEPYLVWPSVVCRPCAAAAEIDDGDGEFTTAGKFRGRVTWGPNTLGEKVDESVIDGYRVYVVNSGGMRLALNDSSTGLDYAFLPVQLGNFYGNASNVRSDCCESEAYILDTWSFTVPVGYDRFSIVAWSSTFGALPAGSYAPIRMPEGNVTEAPRLRIASSARGAANPAVSLLVFFLLAISAAPTR